MQPYGSVADRGAFDLPPQKSKARQSARREIELELWQVQVCAYRFDDSYCWDLVTDYGDDDEVPKCQLS